MKALITILILLLTQISIALSKVPPSQVDIVSMQSGETTNKFINCKIKFDKGDYFTVTLTLKKEFIDSTVLLSVKDKDGNFLASSTLEKSKTQEQSILFEFTVGEQAFKNSKINIYSSNKDVFIELKKLPAQNKYTIRKGDTFLSISKKFNVSVAYLKKLNPNVEESSLQIGHELLLKSKK